jgi:hypothetical protein
MTETQGGGKIFTVHYCEHCKRQRAAYSQWKRDQALAAGRCIRCFKRKPKEGEKECIACLAKKKVAYFARSKHRRRYKVTTTESLNTFIQRRMVAGLCVRCGCEKHDKRRLYCPTCYEVERHMLTSKRARDRKAFLRRTVVVDPFQYLYGDRQDTANCRASKQELATMNHAYAEEAA